MKIDYSQLSCFVNCPRKYYNKYVKCVQKIGYDNADLEFGKCAHKALEIHYKGDGIDAGIKWFIENFHGVEGEKTKTPAHGVHILKQYKDYYSNDVNELSDCHFTPVNIERQGVIKIGDVEYIVKIDLIVKHENGGVYVIDHKFTKSFPTTYFKRFTPNMQVSGYCYWTQKYIGQCSGFIPNVISMSYREKPELFHITDTVLANNYSNTEVKYSKYYKEDMIYASGLSVQFARDIVNRNNKQLSDFEQQVKYHTDNLKRSIDTGVFVKNEDHCHSYSGCQYIPLCESCDDESILDVMYEKVNPFEYLEEGGDEK